MPELHGRKQPWPTSTDRLDPPPLTANAAEPLKTADAFRVVQTAKTLIPYTKSIVCPLHHQRRCAFAPVVTSVDLNMTPEERDPKLEEFLTSRASKTTCPDCDSEMRPITLIDTGDDNVQQKLGYAIGEPERSWFLGRYAEAGKVNAKMCPTCGRIILYADPSRMSRRRS